MSRRGAALKSPAACMTPERAEKFHRISQAERPETPQGDCNGSFNRFHESSVRLQERTSIS
ncbi:MAG: hypothetical protein ACRDRL_27065, partial [Sciscionella sp.]